MIRMDDYRKAKAASVAKSQRYDDEILCVNWNPAVRSIAATGGQTTQVRSPDLPEDFSRIDAEAFLTRVYALATQV